MTRHTERPFCIMLDGRMIATFTTAKQAERNLASLRGQWRRIGRARVSLDHTPTHIYTEVDWGNGTKSHAAVFPRWR